MFKKSSDREAFIHRTGSHATKEYASGRIDAIPTWAKEPEEYYLSLRERVESVRHQLTAAQANMGQLTQKLKNQLPYAEYRIAQSQAAYWSDMCRALGQSLNNYTSLLRAAASNSWALVFYRCAEAHLAPDMLERISKDTTDLLGRPILDDLKLSKKEKMRESLSPEDFEAWRQKKSKKDHERRVSTPDKAHRETQRRKQQRERQALREAIGPRWVKIDGKYQKI